MALALLDPDGVITMDDVPARLNANPWDSASAGQKTHAEKVAALVAGMADAVREGCSVNQVVNTFLARCEAGMLTPREVFACSQLQKSQKGLSAPTLKRWVRAYVAGGKAALLPRIRA